MIKTSNNDIATALAEEKERKLAEERSSAALKLQRKQRLQAMVIKRQRNLAYLKKVHQGGCYWLNAVLLTPNDVHTLIGNSVSKQRVESFFSLGISVSKIVNLAAGLPVVRAFSQLVEEWEYVHSGATMQSVKFVMAKTSPCIYPQMSVIEGFSDLTRPSVYKFNNAIVFEYLQVPHIPYELDYAEVFITLCVELSKLYEKLIHEECYSNSVVYDTIVRLDTRIKHHIINSVSKQVTEVCAAKVKAGTRSLRQLAGIRTIIKSTNSNASLSNTAPNSATSAASASTTRNASPSTKNHSTSATALPLPQPPTPTSNSTHKSKDTSKDTIKDTASTQDTPSTTTTSKVSVDNPIATATATHPKKTRRGHVHATHSEPSTRVSSTSATVDSDAHKSAGGSDAAVQESGSS